uniref:CSON005932 protein n=1 Tax=Culicoides sonorensis TaxID=179676 RepID=A0A336MSA0_CULSO
MAIEDLADQVEDYICTFEGFGDIAMDSLAMFVFIWSLCVLVSIWLGKFLYNKYILKKGSITTETTTTSALPTGPVTKSVASVSSTVPIRKSEPREIVRSSGHGGGGGGGGMSRGLSSTPIRADTPLAGQAQLARKRLTRKSPGPEIRSKNRYTPIPQNIMGEDPSSTTWATRTFRWLYSDLTIVNELLQTWTVAVNDYIRTELRKEEITIEIVRVLSESTVPNLSNLYVEPTGNAHEVLLTCDCECNIVMQAKAFTNNNDKVEVSHYKVTVSRFKAHLGLVMNYITLKGAMRIEGYPDIRLIINSIGAIKPGKEETSVQAAINETLVAALRDTNYPLDFSIYATCPRGMDMEPNYDSYSMTTSEFTLQSEEEYNMYRTRSPTFLSCSRRLLVKVVRGEGIVGAKESYCVVEMDEPAQKNQTNTKPGDNPYWDEHFLFNLSTNSAELLFEVYDSPMKPNGPPKFMGLGLVGIDELSVGLASTQILTLQPRPYETETINGSITVEFVFIEGANIDAKRPEIVPRSLRHAAQSPASPPSSAHNGIKHKTHYNLSSSTPTPSNSTLRTTNISPIAKHEPYDRRNPYNDHKLNAMQTLNGTKEPSMPTSNTNTNANRSNLANQYHHNGLLSPTTNYHSSSATNNNLNNNNNNNNLSPYGASTQNGDHKGSASKLNQEQQQKSQQLQNQQGTDPNLDERGRPKTKRNFFGNIKKRLTRSKSRSVDRENYLDTRSASSDRPSGTLSQSQTGGSQGGTLPSMNLSRRSSISESSNVSGWSSASAKTFVHEASTLVLETVENGVKRHFLVPLAIAQRPRWRRKGTKLHIYNDHTFIAKHISGGAICEVCNRSIMRRPGKQGYECRDCGLKCHKPCHVKTAQVCQKSTILTIELFKLNDAELDRYTRKL